MPSVSELSSAYHAFNDERIDLDRRISVLPDDDIAGRDMLLIEMESVVSHLIDTERQLAATPATSLGGLRAKAEVISWHTETTPRRWLCRSPRMS